MKQLKSLRFLGLFFASCLWGLPVGADDPAATYLIQSGRQPGQIDRVEVRLEIAGDRLRKNDEGVVKRVAMSGLANLIFDEKTLEVAATPEGLARSVRYYERADAVIKAGEEGHKPALRQERRLVAVELDAYKTTIFSTRGTLTSDELDLINQVPGNTLLLDQVLPGRPVAVGQRWKLSDKFLAALVVVDEVRHSDVECRLKEVTPTLARMELSGNLSGMLNGVAAEIDLKAKCRFDRRSNRIDWFAMLISDKRELSAVDDGVDSATRAEIKITGKDESAPLSETALKDLPLRATPESCLLLYQPPQGDWQLMHDRSWFLVESQRDRAVMRMIMQGTDSVQCNISPLEKVAPAKLPTLVQFQEDVRHCAGQDVRRLGRGPAARQRCELPHLSRDCQGRGSQGCRSSGSITWWPTTSAAASPSPSLPRSSTSMPARRPASGWSAASAFTSRRAQSQRSSPSSCGRRSWGKLAQSFA